MNIPIVKFSELKILPKDVIGITIYPYIFLNLRKITLATKLNETIRHEKIHIEQQKELLVIFFYLWYGIEWFIKLFFYGKNAYHNISFERESYKNENDIDYLSLRKRYAFLKFVFLD